MSDRIQIALLIASVIAGLSGWAAIFAWWFRERSKTVRAIKELRKTNSRLQKTVMFTLDKWRDQVERNQIFLAIEQHLAEQVAQTSDLNSNEIKSVARAHVGESHRKCDPIRADAEGVNQNRHQIAEIAEIERYASSGAGGPAELAVDADFRKAA